MSAFGGKADVIQVACAQTADYNQKYIKRGLTRPANLRLVQGGFPAREMWPKGNIERQPSTDKPLEGFIMSDTDRKNGEISPERRLLEAMVTLNAINNGRPVPDMKNIIGGWVVRLDHGMDRQEMISRIKKEIASSRRLNRTAN
jgi:hypothetical protein